MIILKVHVSFKEHLKKLYNSPILYSAVPTVIAVFAIAASMLDSIAPLCVLVGETSPGEGGPNMPAEDLNEPANDL